MSDLSIKDIVECVCNFMKEKSDDEYMVFAKNNEYLMFSLCIADEMMKSGYVAKDFGKFLDDCFIYAYEWIKDRSD